MEAVTRQQANNQLWFHFREGRVTASRMKAVCRTDENNPSQHVIKSVCYPNTSFQTDAMKWGCSHEKTALNRFTEIMCDEHDNVHVRNSGLIISSEQPHIGTSPDAIMTCNCCGCSPVEIKCPYCEKDSKLNEVNNKKFFLQKDSEGNLKLAKDHQHYWQVKAQLD